MNSAKAKKSRQNCAIKVLLAEPKFNFEIERINFYYMISHPLKVPQITSYLRYIDTLLSFKN